MATQVLAIDDLDYTYDAGNRLQKVVDNTNHPAGFNMNGAGANDTFVYDKYGNLMADPYKKISTILYNHLNLPTKITFLSGGKIEYFYDATGTKLKKKVTDGTTITTTEYMQGFQYTNNVLDFFPHPEGYVKALPAGLGGGSSYQFKYVFTYTDHLGNIRLKYAQDPSNNNRISILEEDHYYPYGLKHSGYNSFHQIFTTEDGDGQGTGIVLTPVNPFLGDSHKYKFGGMEYQDEFDINTYDFGARNYDPALGRWMNIDPLAEAMRRHSPYNYAFDNPVYFIDPDGMMPGGFANTNSVTSTGAFESYGGGGFDVRTFDKATNETLDFKTVSSLEGVSYNTQAGAISTNSSGA
ncbi:RHS repeat domain-containing protein [Aequorivita viscosa]|uniref:RHS repeat-associated core domain-containing protein n=1 Tax=Aequorivita viscosa TaxID=797419 RepID=A0A1M6PN55_9FLAO|nr:RHS repeat-associated core domain-containing protein [Aequorivita viscosa]SDX56461.1 RHS repeat-associated core domain-containing protein [Aequorivita viscosa]SHK09342.1 RHS repeat-associated core domain-containing protein [Aequorivita viscosa]